VYWPLVPKLELTGGTGPFFAVASAFEGSAAREPGVPARHWEFRGLGFWIDISDPLSSIDISSGFIRTGNSGSVWAKAGGSFTSLTVASNVATATGNTAHGFKVGDAVQMSGLTGAGAAMNGLRSVTGVPTSTTFQFAAAGVGDGTYTESTMYFVSPGEVSQIPDDIVIDRCIFTQGGLSKVRRAIYLNSANTTIKNSFISSGRSAGADSQMILGINGSGPIVIDNNYLAGAVSENIMFGGGRTTLPDPFSDIKVQYNYLAHPPLEARTRTWTLLKSDGGPVLRGRVVRPTIDNGWYYIARNLGAIGATEPDWSDCTAPGCTVSDGTVVWERFYASNLCAWCIKNNFELKAAKDISLTHNVFEYMWFAGQSRAINIKSEQQSLYPNFGNNCVPTFSGTVNTNGTTVTRVSGLLPYQANVAATYGTDPMRIIINGTPYTIARFDTADSLTLTTSAGTQTGVGYRYGTDPSVRWCQAALTQNVNMSHNIVRNTSTPFVINPGTNAHRGLTGGFTLRHNLFERTDPTVWTNEVGTPYHTTTSHLFFTPIVDKFTADHNTILGSNVGWALYGDQSSSEYPGDTVITNNIWGKNVNGFYRSTEHTGMSAALCRSTTCPPSQWSHNILLGMNITSYAASPGSVANLCSGSAACASPSYGLLFRDFSRGKLDVNPSTAFSRKSTDGSDYGADISQLPQIRDLSVTATDRLAVFQYRITQPIAHIPCVVEVSAIPDFSTYAGELANIGSYWRQDSDDVDRLPREGLQRAIVVGQMAPLAAGMLHYYRLHCGGDVRTGTFTTEHAVSGTTERALTFRATSTGPQTLYYGHAYSRSSGQIIGAQTATANCMEGDSCSIKYDADRGQLLYWRLGVGALRLEAIP
jgi:hypothetical protein